MTRAGTEKNTQGKIANELEEHFADLVKDMSRACESAGYKEIDYFLEDEYIGELIAANDYKFRFDEDGGCEQE